MTDMNKEQGAEALSDFTHTMMSTLSSISGMAVAAGAEPDDVAGSMLLSALLLYLGASVSEPVQRGLPHDKIGEWVQTNQSVLVGEITQHFELAQSLFLESFEEPPEQPEPSRIITLNG